MKDWYKNTSPRFTNVVLKIVWNEIIVQTPWSYLPTKMMNMNCTKGRYLVDDHLDSVSYSTLYTFPCTGKCIESLEKAKELINNNFSSGYWQIIVQTTGKRQSGLHLLPWSAPVHVNALWTRDGLWDVSTSGWRYPIFCYVKHELLYSADANNFLKYSKSEWNG